MPALGEFVTGPTGGAGVDGVEAALAGHVRSHAKGPGAGDEPPGVTAPVGTQGQLPRAPLPLSGEQEKCRLRFGSAGGRAEGAVHDEAVAVLGEQMRPIGELVCDRNPDLR